MIFRIRTGYWVAIGTLTCFKPMTLSLCEKSIEKSIGLWIIYKSLLQFCLWCEILLKLLNVYIINVQDCLRIHTFIIYDPLTRFRKWNISNFGREKSVRTVVNIVVGMKSSCICVYPSMKNVSWLFIQYVAKSSKYSYVVRLGTKEGFA